MKNILQTSAFRVSEHYENNGVNYEKIRLEQDSPVEFALMLRVLDKWIKAPATVLDVGVGVGHYAIHLAKRGCELHLVDVCYTFLKLTQERFDQENLLSKILTSTQSSAENLYSQPDQSVDYVLMLGPFYHIISKKQRWQAVFEAHRVLKKGGLLFAAGINRLALLHEIFHADRFSNDKFDSVKLGDHLRKYCNTGISDAELFPSFGDAYCSTVDEFRKLFAPSFIEVDFLGLESFTAFKQNNLFNYTNDELSFWLSIIEKTARTVEGQASSEHFLYVGQKL